MKKIVYFVRHGQTEGNVLKYAQSSKEPLNEVGVKQAQDLALRCKDLGFSKVIASDMLRAIQTANIIVKQNTVAIQTSALLKEVSLSDDLSGPLNGLATNPVIQTFKRELPLHLEDANDDWFAQYGAESYRAIQSRARAVLSMLADDEAEELLVVSHDTFMKFIFAEMLLEDSATMKQLHFFRKKLEMKNTGITKVIYDKGTACWHLVTFNDHAHFADN